MNGKKLLTQKQPTEGHQRAEKDAVLSVSSPVNKIEEEEEWI